MTITPEHPAAKKLRALLTLAAGALALGNQGEAVAASNGARKVADEAGLARIYICYHRTCPLVASRMLAETSCCEAYMSATTPIEWARARAFRADCGMPDANPVDYVIVGCVATGAIDKYGAHKFFPDWTDAHSASHVAIRALPAS